MRIGWIKKNLIVVFAVMAFGGVFAGETQGGATGTGSGVASVINPVLVVSVAELSFGQVRPGGTDSGTVIVTPQNTRSSTGGTGLAAGNPPYSRAEFDVSGPASTTYSMQLSGTVALHDKGGNNLQLNVTDLVGFSLNLGLEGTLGLFDASGQDMVYVGGTLHVPTREFAKNGKYEGDVVLTIDVS